MAGNEAVSLPTSLAYVFVQYCKCLCPGLVATSTFIHQRLTFHCARTSPLSSERSLSHQIECCVSNHKRTYSEPYFHQSPKSHLSPTNPQLTNNSQNNTHQTTHISNRMCTHSNTTSPSASNFTLSHRVSTVPACRYCFRTLSWNPLLRRWNCQSCHLYF